ncbi:MAG: VanZ family protein [Candidatus Omnitrophica bacterium]|nr:VanZ family protein [Candidatus Omnitrophota bacterium]
MLIEYCLPGITRDEIHQYFILGRCCSVKDILIDSIGIICFYIVIKFKNSIGDRFLGEIR